MSAFLRRAGRLASRVGYGIAGVLAVVGGLFYRGVRRLSRFLWSLPADDALVRDFRFQHVMLSRFLSDVSQQAIAYGALIHVVQQGGNAFDAALIGVAALIPPAVLGLYAGVISDALPKRVALGAGYLVQAVICFAMPGLAGTGVGALMLLIISVHTIGQVSGPAESSIIPLVASKQQRATAASLLSFSSAAGTAVGSALLAPAVLKVSDVEPVIYIAGALLLLASTRVLTTPVRQRMAPFVFDHREFGPRASIDWLIRHPGVATMILGAVVVGTMSTVVQTLAPQFVDGALGVDASNSVYVFAPTSVGMIAALFAGPLLMRVTSERAVAVAGVAVVATTVLMLGMIDRSVDLIDPVNPFAVFNIIGPELGDGLRTAAFLSMPFGLGVTLTATAAHTYINNNVPLTYQGRTFAVQGMLKNGMAIIPLLTLGAVASVTGVEVVFVLLPFALALIVGVLIRLSYRYTGRELPPRGDILRTLVTESGALDVSASGDAPAPPTVPQPRSRRYRRRR